MTTVARDTGCENSSSAAPRSGENDVAPTSSAIIGITSTTSCVSEVAVRARSCTPLPPEST